MQAVEQAPPAIWTSVTRLLGMVKPATKGRATKKRVESFMMKSVVIEEYVVDEERS